MLYKVCPEKVMKGTSLVVQWLGIHASNAGGMDWIPGQGTKIPHATWHGQKITADDDCTHETKRCLLLGRKAMKKPRQYTQKQRHHFANKGPSSQGYGFTSSHVWMWGLDHNEGWEPKNWCFRTVVLEKTLESPLDSKQIKPASSKGNQPWIFAGRTDAEAEAQILWPPDAKSRLIGKDPDAGKNWRQEEKETTEDEMVG